MEMASNFVVQGSWISHGNHEYFISSDTKTFYNSISNCRSMMSDLASIKSEETQMFLMRNIPSTSSNSELVTTLKNSIILILKY